MFPVTTTWGYRFSCPECGFESVTQDADLRDNLIEWHDDAEHDGQRVGEWTEETDIPVDELPEDESPDFESATDADGISQQVIGNV